jgi:hypothetical protein
MYPYKKKLFRNSKDQFCLDSHFIFVYLEIKNPLRDRLAAGRRVLAPLTQVRILVPQPKNNGL